MSKIIFCKYIFILLFLLFSFTGVAQDTLMFKGQASSWVHLNPSGKLPVWVGGRYIPTLQYLHQLQKGQLLDFEASANIYGSIGMNPFDTSHMNGSIKPYRVWARYSTNQLEIRLGMQKINFGQAVMLRPLMWFAKLDPRDPLQLTDGVWGLLGRYYFLNNVNLWFWGLYGNNNAKTWEVGKTVRNHPEFGGRFQFPVPAGEAAISYHHRKADMRTITGIIAPDDRIPENRIGVDAKWDLEVGLWVEGTWIHKDKFVGAFTNQEFMTGGIDYTFGLGNGLNVVYEQMVFALDEKAFAFSEVTSFSAISVNYPLNMSDNINAIFYFDWNSQLLYNFINWKHQFNKFYVYLMGYWNPKEYRMPQQGNAGDLFAGKGIQIMLIFNH